MEFPNKFNQLSTPSDLTQALEGVSTQTAYELNCARIGIVQAFHAEDLTVDVLIANKKGIGYNLNGSPIVRDYAQIRAKIVFCNPFISCPINAGDECILLFSDREIESWFINGGVNPLGYQRMHDLTDAVAIFGIRSLPKMISILADCLNLFYGTSNIALSSDHININADTVQASNFHAMNGATGALVDSNGKKLADVVDGIITEIS